MHRKALIKTVSGFGLILACGLCLSLARTAIAQNGGNAAESENTGAAASNENTGNAAAAPALQPPPLPASAPPAAPLSPALTAAPASAPDAASAAPVLPGAAPEKPAAAAVPDFFAQNPALTPEPAINDPAAAQTYQKSQEELQTEARKQAFDAALDGLLPLKPNEIRELLEKFDRTQESVELPVYPSPKPQFAVQTLSLDPGTQPAVIKLAYGNVTTLNILDSSGSPWPIEDVSWAGNFEIVEAGSGDGSHIIRISPQSDFATGNISIRLLTLKTPVILSLETSRDTVHYRFDAIVPQAGPLAHAPLIETGVTTAAGDQTITAILQGVVPPAAVKYEISGVDGRTTAYHLGGKTYVRTPLTLLSPGWSGSVSSADGMNVYAIAASAPVLLLSDEGKMIRAKLAERVDILQDASP